MQLVGGVIALVQKAEVARRPFEPLGDDTPSRQALPRQIHSSLGRIILGNVLRVAQEACGRARDNNLPPTDLRRCTVRRFEPQVWRRHSGYSASSEPRHASAHALQSPSPFSVPASALSVPRGRAEAQRCSKQRRSRSTEPSVRWRRQRSTPHSTKLLTTSPSSPALHRYT